MPLQIEKLSPDLFWDVDPNGVDPDEHGVWLLSRILELGSMEDWRLAWRYFGKDDMSVMEPRLKISPKSRNFLRRWLDAH